MARTGWASPEEREYLLAQMPEYEECQVKRRYKAFWQRVNAEFLTKFPVIDKLFPGLNLKVDDLSVEQKEMHTTAVKRQQQRLKEWYRWQLSPRSRSAGAAISKKDLHSIYNGRTRNHKPYEIFAKLYSQDVEAEKARRCEVDNIMGRKIINVWQDVAKEMYSSATEEQLEAVKKQMCEEEVTTVEDTVASPEEYQRYLKKLPTLLGAAITPAVTKAGVLAFLTLVGPDPEQYGKITCKSIQFGDKPDTPVFSQEWDGHDSIFVEELARFAPPEVCAARSLTAFSGVTTDGVKREERTSDNERPSSSQNAPSEAPSTDVTPVLATSLRNQSPKETPSTPGESPPKTGAGNNTSPSAMSSSGSAPQSHELQGPNLQEGGLLDVPGGCVGAGGSDDDTDDDEDEENVFGGLHPMNTSDAARATPRDPSFSGAPTFVWKPSIWAAVSWLGINFLGHICSSATAIFTFQLTPHTIRFRRTGQERFFRNSWRLSTSSARSLSPSCPLSPSFQADSVAPIQQIVNCNSFNQSSLLDDYFPGTQGYPYTFDNGFPSSPVSLDTSTAYQIPSYASEPFISRRAGVSLPPPANLTGSSLSFPLTHQSSSTFFTPEHPSRTSVLLTSMLNGTAGTNSTTCSGGSLPDSTTRAEAQSPQGAHQMPFPSQTPVSTYSPQQSASAYAPQPFPNAGRNPSSLEGPRVDTFEVPRAPSANTSSQSLVTPTPSSATQGSRTSPPKLSSEAVKSSITSPPPPSAPHQKDSTSSPPSVDRQIDTSPPSEAGNENSASETACRRSARGFVPSKRNEQLQLIGSNAPQTGVDSGASGSKGWFTSAIEGLRLFDLGPDWMDLVEKWGAFETGPGKSSKTPLKPKLRPTEWTQWTSKAWQGNRRYDIVPTIQDPADLGIATMRWWSSLQPAFRASDNDFPLEVYTSKDAGTSDIWSTLRKTGPNGFVAVLLLAAWWGKSAMTETTRWGEDSRPAWHKFIIDVKNVVIAMSSTASETVPSNGAKPLSQKENNAPAPNKKRKRQ
ncbi:hypothetical protein NMY22_g8325 [Coprinellus aureogranulatus]|nr:hypothetical protein NMY22_g8325 [Coprinellus aureogranulatus]